MSKAFKCDRCGQFYAQYESKEVHSISDAINAMVNAIHGLLAYKISYQIMRMKDGSIDEEDESLNDIKFEPVNLKGYEFSSSSDIVSALGGDENDSEEDNM